MEKKRINVCRWEGNEFIIEIDGKPQGGTLTEDGSNAIKEWMLSLPDDLIKTTVYEIKDSIIKALDNLKSNILMKNYVSATEEVQNEYEHFSQSNPKVKRNERNKI